MKLIIIILIYCICLLGCDSRVENRKTDAFGWQELRADCDPDSARIMGFIDKAQFIAAITDFPWYEQAMQANLLGKVSPTLSVEDLLNDHTFFISSGCSDDGSDFGYFVGFIYPRYQKNLLGIDRTYRQVDVYLVRNMTSVYELTDIFFKRDHNSLNRILSAFPILQKSPERISWKQYLLTKQTYFQ